MVIDNNNSISIGRGNCDIIVPHPKVSQHHADIRVEVQSGHTRYFFQDRSSNGTMIDGNTIHNSEVEIYPEARPVILLAGTAELKWETVEAIFKRKSNFVSVPQNIQQPPLGHIITPQYTPDPSPVNVYQQPEVIVHNAVKKGDDASAGFGRAFGETTGKAVGCLVVVVTIIIVLIFIIKFV
jgi:hypothetical protein